MKRKRDKKRAKVCSSDECGILKKQQKHFTSKNIHCSRFLTFSLVIGMSENTHKPFCSPQNTKIPPKNQNPIWNMGCLMKFSNKLP